MQRDRDLSGQVIFRVTLANNGATAAACSCSAAEATRSASAASSGVLSATTPWAPGVANCTRNTRLPTVTYTQTPARLAKKSSAFSSPAAATRTESTPLAPCCWETCCLARSHTQRRRCSGRFDDACTPLRTALRCPTEALRLRQKFAHLLLPKRRNWPAAGLDLQAPTAGSPGCRAARTRPCRESARCCTGCRTCC